jgi:hypothetical protein
VEQDREELGLDPLEQKIDVPRPAEAGGLSDHGEALILFERAAYRLGLIVAAIDRYQHARRLMALRLDRQQGLADKSFGLEGRYAYGDRVGRHGLVSIQLQIRSAATLAK